MVTDYEVVGVCLLTFLCVAGMESLWVIGNADEIVSIPLDVSQHYFSYGGDVYGNGMRAPVLYHYFDDNNKCVDMRATNCTATKCT